MSFEMKILIGKNPLPTSDKEKITREDALKVVQGIVERLKKEPGWTVQSSSAPATSGDPDRWHEFTLVKGPLHEMNGLNEEEEKVIRQGVREGFEDWEKKIDGV